MEKQYNFCTHCGSKQKLEDVYCKACTFPRREAFQESSEHHCSDCGSPLDPNDKFCYNCGYRSNIPGTITPKPKPKEPGYWDRFAKRHPELTQVIRGTLNWLIFWTVYDN